MLFIMCEKQIMSNIQANMLSSKDEISQWLVDHLIEKRHFEIVEENNQFIVNVQTDVHLKNQQIGYFPFQFGHIDGNFNCIKNSLISLKGAPFSVSGEFNASHNFLSTWQHLPKKVSILNLSNNNLTSFDNVNCYISEGLYVFNNSINELIGFPSFSKKAFIILDKYLPFLSQYNDENQNKNYKMLTVNAHTLMAYIESFKLNLSIATIDENKDKKRVKI